MAYVAILAIADGIQWDRTGERWGYTAMVVLSALLLLRYSREYSELRSPLQAPVGGMFLACASGIVVLFAWINLDAPLLRFSDQEGFEPISKCGRMEWEWALLRIGGSVLVVPLIEELFWRSFLLRWLEKPNFLAVNPSDVSHRSILLCSAAFALEHAEWAAGLFAGLVYSWLYVRSGSLVLPVLAHATTNLGLGLWVLHTEQWTYW